MASSCATARHTAMMIQASHATSMLGTDPAMAAVPMKIVRFDGRVQRQRGGEPLRLSMIGTAAKWAANAYALLVPKAARAVGNAADSRVCKVAGGDIHRSPASNQGNHGILGDCQRSRVNAGCQSVTVFQVFAGDIAGNVARI